MCYIGRRNENSDQGYTEPYRLYNLDVFEYIDNSPMALYGSIPFLTAHRSGSTVGVFLLNSAEMWIDVEKNEKGTQTHWMAESGTMDLFIFLEDEPKQVLEKYTQLTGRPYLPPMFSIGHHQCRWNYLSQDDVLEVSKKFDEYELPMDVLWLDIEYTEDKKYFIWDKNNFAEPEKMMKGLADRGRKVGILYQHLL
jgi:mannosyl-oligosaccharide alpha-1,3-glucosidase